MLWRIPFCAFLLTAALTLAPCLASIVWTPEGGFEQEGSMDAGSSRDTLALAKKFESEQKYSEALKAYRTGARKYPNAFVAAEMHYGWARMVEIEGDYARAFKIHKTIVERYPNTEYFDKALENMFVIANLFLAGERQRLWKIPTLPSMDKAAEYFEQIVKTAPYSRLAPEAQFKVGVARERQKKWDKAIEAYQKVLNKYPNHDIASLAQYQIGYAWMKSSSDADYDQSAAMNAIEAFDDFLTRYPNSEKVAQAKDNIDLLKGRQNQGAFNIARYYDRTGEPVSAVIYYNEVIEANPESENAKFAARRIEELNRIIAEERANNPDKAKVPLPFSTTQSSGGPTKPKSEETPGSNGPPVPANLPEP